MLNFSERFDVEKYGWEGAPLHDPCVTAFVLRPDIFTARPVNVEVETGSLLTRGMTVCDYWGVTDRPQNAHWRKKKLIRAHRMLPQPSICPPF